MSQQITNPPVTTDWSRQLDSARERVASGDGVTAFLRAFGALESCFSHEASLPVSTDETFADAALELLNRKRLRRDEFNLAEHLRRARNCVAHKMGFEPSLAEAQRTIDHVHRLCSRFATKVHEVMIKPVLTARPSDPLGPLVDKMRDHGISQFPVVDDMGRVTGTLFEKAVLDALLADGGLIDLDQPVAKLSSPDILPDIAANATVDDARRRLKAPGVSALLVLADRRPTGIVTRFDVIG
jgi:predicted transcriptional regulator